jgi:hypothetical protein
MHLQCAMRCKFVLTGIYDYLDDPLITACLSQLIPDPKLSDSYLLSSVVSWLNRRCDLNDKLCTIIIVVMLMIHMASLSDDNAVTFT